MVDKKTKANAVSLIGAAIRTGTLTKQEYCSYCYHNDKMRDKKKIAA